MIQEQLSLFDLTYPKFKLNKKVRLISLFSGYDSQYMALKRLLGDRVESYKTCEWAVKSIQALKDAHYPDDNTDYSATHTHTQILDYLYKKGISMDYNQPMTYEQIKRLGEQKCRTIYNNIIATHNQVNIMQVKGGDLEIVEQDKYQYIMTYSFPCQDLSLAGKQKGLKDNSTRSGMLWEVERILDELHEKGIMIDCLLMENVPPLIGQKFIKDFQKWELKLESLGYHNEVEILNAKDYGIPQNRERVFCVSIPKETSYTFPCGFKLEKRLKDLLEENVDEKYYLSDKQISDVSHWNAQQKPLEEMERTEKKGVSPCLTTRTGAYVSSMILVKNNTKQGYLLAEEGDGVDISSRMESHRGTVQKGMSQTLTTQLNVGVVVNMKNKLCNTLIEKNIVKERDVINHSYTNGLNGKNPNSRQKLEDYIERQDGLFPALTTRPDCLGYVSNLRIRKLTPKECFRLMGVSDEDFNKIAKNQSDASLYHLAGDSIVVDVLYHIFKGMD